MDAALLEQLAGAFRNELRAIIREEVAAAIGAAAPRIAPPATREDVDGDELLDVAEAAALLRSTANTLNGWRSQGRGPRFVRLGRSIRYRRADCLRFAERSTVCTAGDPAASSPAPAVKLRAVGGAKAAGASRRKA